MKGLFFSSPEKGFFMKNGTSSPRAATMLRAACASSSAASRFLGPPVVRAIEYCVQTGLAHTQSMG
jgi:hypothetical protein